MTGVQTCALPIYENWSRRWDGNDAHILIEQRHSPEDDENFIHQLITVLKDKRYIRVNNRLLLLIYRVDRMPDPSKSAKTWREIVKKEINEELYLCAVNNFIKDIDPALIGFDATVQFPLDFHPPHRIDVKQFAKINGVDFETVKDHWIIDYPGMVNHMAGIVKPTYKFFRGVFPSWDNTPRRQNSSAIFINSSPEIYKLFLKATLALTRVEHSGDEQLVFINAWNEWAEGAHLEPDQKYGLRWLEVTKEALTEKDEGFDVMEALNNTCIGFTKKISADEQTKEIPNKRYEIPLSSEMDTILNSYTFKVGSFIMWFPIKILNILKRFKIVKYD